MSYTEVVVDKAKYWGREILIGLGIGVVFVFVFNFALSFVPPMTITFVVGIHQPKQ